MALATHPTEGALSLDALIQEALANNPEIKSAESGLQAATSRYKSTLGVFSPEVSIEGGPLTTRFDSESHSGTAAYGKAEWNLYRGGKDAAERAKQGVEQRLAQSRLSQAKAKIAREVARAYYEMAFLLESISIKEKALALNQEQTKLAVVKKSAGFTSEADVIEFDLREATIQSDIKELRYELEGKSKELSVLLGRSDSTSRELAVKGHLQRSAQKPNKNMLVQKLSDLNPEIVEAKASLESSKEARAVARSGLLPKLDLHAKYGKLANEERVFSESNSYSVGVTLNIPLFSGFSSINDVSAATAEVAKADFQVTKHVLSAKAEAETLFSRLETILERSDLEEKTLSRSEQYYKITLGEYRRGIKNSPDMVGASERLLNSNIRNLEFRRDYQITLLGLLALVGAPPNENSWFSDRVENARREKVLAPGEVYEECMKLEKPQGLSYSYESSAPLDFNIHYHVGESVEYPIKKNANREFKGIFRPTSTQ